MLAMNTTNILLSVMYYFHKCSSVLCAFDVHQMVCFVIVIMIIIVLI